MSDQVNTEPEISGRGLAYYEPTKTSYGHEVRIYTSSAAMAPHIWLTNEGEAHLAGEPRPVAGISHGVAPGSVSAHMSLDQAREIHEKLGAAIKLTEEQWGLEPGQDWNPDEEEDPEWPRHRAARVPSPPDPTA